MVKRGPCCHCGATSTPLWRNGPLEKPVLCNACGSRWRTKGSLANYTPIVARIDSENCDNYKIIPRVRTIFMKNNPPKRKHQNDIENTHGFQHALVDENTGNISSSGSVVSNSESCTHLGRVNATDFTAPSRKRSYMISPKPSSVEKLTKDLYTILHEQQSKCFSGSSEEELLFKCDTPMVIGHGSVLMKQPSSTEEESEATSLSFDKHNFVNETYTPIVHIKNQGASFLGESKSGDKLHILRDHNSVLQHVDLKDVVNFKKFVKHLTKEEQQGLLNYLPSDDTANAATSLATMFDSSQFQENLCSFQQLLAEGVFDVSLTGVKGDDCKTLKCLALLDLSKFKWIELYNLLKNCRHKGRQQVGERGTYMSKIFQRQNECSNDDIIEANATTKNPKTVIPKGNCDSKVEDENEGSFFSPRSFFAMSPDIDSLMLLDSFHFVEQNYDEDLPLDTLTSNAALPQAQLLYPYSIGHNVSM